MASLLGQRIGQYEISGLLGSGGMAAVYRAHQLTVQRDVALKVIKPDLLAANDTADGLTKRFEREAQTIARLSHPNIIKLFDFGRQGDLLYLVMELISGGSLNQTLSREFLPLPTISRIVQQTAAALTYAHQLGIIHRDLKPQNVLLDSNGNAILTDFGIAKWLHETTIGQTGGLIGTPGYMAPEQWRGETISPQTDIYALGVMLFQMATGDLPFRGETSHAIMYQHLQALPPSVKEYRPEAFQAIDAIIAKALAKLPSMRYDSAVALAEDFERAIKGNPSLILALPNDSTFISQDYGGGAPTLPVTSPTDVSIINPPDVVPPRNPTQDTASATPTRRGRSLRVLLGGSILLACVTLIVVSLGSATPWLLLSTGDSQITVIGLLISIALAVTMIAPVVVIWRRRWRLRWLVVVAQILLIIVIAAGKNALFERFITALNAQIHQEASAGHDQQTSDLLHAIAVLQPSAAQMLAGEFNQQGVQAEAAGQLTEARLYFQTVSALDSDHQLDVGRTDRDKANSEYNLGYLHELESNPQAAIDAYQTALQFDASDLDARYALSSLLLINKSDERAAQDQGISIARAGWETYIPASFCQGQQNLADADTYTNTWNCFSLQTVEAGLRLKRHDSAQGDTPSQMESLGSHAVALAEANGQFRAQGQFTAEAYYYLALATAPNTDSAVLCNILRNYDVINPRHRPWAEYAQTQLGGKNCQ